MEIGRVSVHLAALERSVLPTAEHTIVDGAASATALARRGRDLSDALYRLDRHLTGDMLLAGLSTGQLVDEVQARAAEQAQAERTVLAALMATLDEGGLVTLARAYHRAAIAAPTRPHPHLPSRGWRRRIAGTLAGRLDRVRDTLDSRPVSVPIRAAATQAMADLDAPTRDVDPTLGSIPAAAVAPAA